MAAVAPTKQAPVVAAVAPTKQAAAVAPTKLVPVSGGTSTKFVPIRSIDQPSRFQKPAPEVAASLVYEEPLRLTHHEQWISKGMLENIVMTKEGPVSQEQFFQTGARTYYIQEYGPDGNIKFKGAASTRPEGRPVTFAAPRQHWDPTRSAPPMHGAPEADNFNLRPFQNQWDNPKPSKNFVAPNFAAPPKQHIWYDIPKSEAQKPVFPWESKARHTTRVFQEDPESEIELWSAEVEVEQPKPAYRAMPSQQAKPQPQPRAMPPATQAMQAPSTVGAPLKALFPWEEKPRTVTRVFAGEAYNPAIMYEPMYAGKETEEEEDEEPEEVYDDQPADADSWGWFSSRENKWDTDPAIRDYVLGLKRRKIVSADVPLGISEVVSSPPIGRSGPTWPSGNFDDDQDEEWVSAFYLMSIGRLVCFHVLTSSIRTPS